MTTRIRAEERERGRVEEIVNLDAPCRERIGRPKGEENENKEEEASKRRHTREPVTTPPLHPPHTS